MGEFRFPKQVRLLRAREFERVFAARSSATDGSISLYGAANELGYARLGLTISRRIGGATARNRWKRVVREAFRLTQHALPPFDLVCVARSSAPPDLQALIAALPRLVARIEGQIKRDASRTYDRDE
jgi:ribonuclease P protein component